VIRTLRFCWSWPEESCDLPGQSCRTGLGDGLRYLPHGADDAARLRRRRPRAHKLVASPRLRSLVQRKLNRYWSPDEICGWLRLTFPADESMRLCAETIYRALLLPNGRGLDTRYCSSLRTGRRIRKCAG